MHTGDLGHLDDDGYLWVTGRNKDLIVLSGGKKVQPEEVEIALQRSPHIREVCVVGIPQQNGALAGSIELTAVIVPQDSLRDHEARGELENFIREELDRASEELAPYKRPSAIRITWDELPKTSTRKIKRVQVLKRFSEVSAP